MFYPFQCPNCGKQLDFNALVDDRNKLKPICPDCSVSMKRLFVAPDVIIKYLPKDFGRGMDAKKEQLQSLKYLEERGKMTSKEAAIEKATMENDLN